MSQPMTIEEYSEKSFVVRGDTKPYKNDLIARHGRYNPNLRGGGGWVFSKRHLKNIQTYISENTDISRKRKNFVDLDYYKKKLRKTIKEEVRVEVEREFAQQKPFMLDQWRSEIIKEDKSMYFSTIFRNISVCLISKPILILFIFVLLYFFSFIYWKHGTEEYERFRLSL